MVPIGQKVYIDTSFKIFYYIMIKDIISTFINFCDIFICRKKESIIPTHTIVFNHKFVFSFFCVFIIAHLYIYIYINYVTHDY